MRQILIHLICLALTILIFISVKAQSHDKKITLPGTSLPGTELVDILKRQSGYRFNYPTTITPLLNKVVISPDRQISVHAALELLKKYCKINYLIDVEYITLSTSPESSSKNQNTSSDDGTLTGRIINAETSAPLAGASIKLEPSGKVVLSNQSGYYRFGNLGAGEFTVTISYTGYSLFTGRVSVNGTQVFDVKMKPSDNNNMADVVVTTALGISKEKKSLGYAIQTVSGETMSKVKVPTVSSALTGKVAGLNIANTTDFFQSPTISLRGETPLIVIDGIPDPSADLYKLNEDDIESVTVLKGAAAGALYGSIGIHGAIMITTKKGKKGTSSVEVNSSNMFQTGYTVVPKLQTQYGQGDYGIYAYVDGSGNGSEGGGWDWGPKLNQKDPSTQSGYVEVPQWNSPYDPNVTYSVTLPNGTTLQTHYKPLPLISRGTNNINNFFRTGLLTSNTVSATFGSDKGSFRISGSDVYQKGVVPNTGLNDASFSIGGNYNLTSKLNVEGKLSYNKQFSNNYPTVGYGPPNILYNLIIWMTPDVDVRDLKDYWQPGKVGTQQRNFNYSWFNNPYFVAYQYLNGYHKNTTYGELAFTYQISKDLSAKIRSGFNQYALDQDTKEPYSYIAYSYISKGNYSESESNYFDITTDLILTYKHTFGRNFNISVNAGGSNYYTNNKGNTVSTDGLTIPGFYSLSNSTNAIKASSFLDERKINSVYGMVDAELFNFIYLSATGRNDVVSTLNPAYHSYFYPSFGISAVLSDILKLPEPISFLKVRSSWAQLNSGVISSNPYAYIQTYSIGNKWNNVPSLVWPSSTIDQHLIPNSTHSSESGVVLGLFKNRLNVDVTYFRNSLYNNFVQVPLSQASGYTSVLENANVYLRKGWEFMINGAPIKTDNFRWESSFNFSNNHTWLSKATNSTDGYIQDPSNSSAQLKVGDRMDKIILNNYLTPNRQVIYGTNGMPAANPSPVYNQYLGNSDPSWIYGWQNTFTHRNISISFSFDGRLGGYIYSTTNQKLWWGGQSPGDVNQYRDDANAGKSTYIGKGVVVTSGSATYDSHGNITSDTRQYAPNTQAVNYISYMQTTSGGPFNNYFYYSGTYLKLRELVLTYNLPKKWIKGVVNEASVSFVSNNLFLWAKLPNVDPDAEADNLQTPSMRSLGFNINIKF